MQYFIIKLLAPKWFFLSLSCVFISMKITSTSRRWRLMKAFKTFYHFDWNLLVFPFYFLFSRTTINTKSRKSGLFPSIDSRTYRHTFSSFSSASSSNSTSLLPFLFFLCTFADACVVDFILKLSDIFCLVLHCSFLFRHSTSCESSVAFLCSTSLVNHSGLSKHIQIHVLFEHLLLWFVAGSPDV